MDIQDLKGRAAVLKITGPRATITTAEREALAVALVLQGYSVDSAHRMLFDATAPQYVNDNDGALQMLARFRQSLGGAA